MRCQAGRSYTFRSRMCAAAVAGVAMEATPEVGQMEAETAAAKGGEPAALAEMEVAAMVVVEKMVGGGA